MAVFELDSAAFTHLAPIPRLYTCDGADISPPLRWTDPPAGPPPGTQALALVVDDPDAPRGVFTHWVVYDIPADVRELKEGIPDRNPLPAGAREGTNDFGNVGYGGPCPPPGPAHRYVFTLYGLDTRTGLPEGADKRQLLDAISGNVLDEVRLIGTYARAAKKASA
jgi:Raf kinase inhibitor-like YbhB/YbcL family protein